MMSKPDAQPATNNENMTRNYIHPHAMYFEDFIPELVLESPARTVTESEVSQFAQLTGDYNPLHTDAEFGKTTPFGQNIAHGLLGLSMAVGLIARLGVIEGTIIAFLDLNWRFQKPIMFGDTIHVLARVKEARVSKSKNDRGVVVLDVTVHNQRGEDVMQGAWTFMMRRRSADS